MVGMELPRESDRVIEAAQRLFAGRDGRIALTLVLAVTAALEASLYTPDMPEFPFEESSHDPAGAVILNVLAVLPCSRRSRFPFLAAAAASFFSLVILASSETPVTLSALGVLLYAIGTPRRPARSFCAPARSSSCSSSTRSSRSTAAEWTWRASGRSCSSSPPCSPASRIASGRRR